MADIRPTGKKISQVKKDLLSPATTSHFLASVGLPNGAGLKEIQQEIGLTFNSDQQEKLNLLCSETALPQSFSPLCFQAANFSFSSLTFCTD